VRSPPEFSTRSQEAVFVHEISGSTQVPMRYFVTQAAWPPHHSRRTSQTSAALTAKQKASIRDERQLGMVDLDHRADIVLPSHGPTTRSGSSSRRPIIHPESEVADAEGIDTGSGVAIRFRKSVTHPKVPSLEPIQARQIARYSRLVSVCFLFGSRVEVNVERPVDALRNPDGIYGARGVPYRGAQYLSKRGLRVVGQSR